MQGDRRDSYRIRVGRHQVSVDSPMVADNVGIVDLSASGLAVEIEPSAVESITRAPLLIKPGDYAPFETEVSAVNIEQDHSSDSFKLGLRFNSLNVSAMRSLAGFVADRFSESNLRTHLASIAKDQILTIRDRQRVSATLQLYGIERAIALHVYSASGYRLPVSCCVTSVRSHSAIPLIDVAFVGDPRILKHGQIITITFPGAHALNFFETRLVEVNMTSHTGQLLFPDAIKKTAFRISERVVPGSRLDVSLLNHEASRTPIEKEVIDLSLRGLSFHLDPENDMLFPGQKVMLEIGNGFFWAEAVVRSIGKRHNLGQLLCGVELARFGGKQHLDRWNDLVFSNSFKDLTIGSKESVGECWKLLQTSRYVDETTPEIQMHLQHAFHKTWHRAYRRSLSDRLVMSRHDDAPIGTISVSQLFQGTWLLHHVAVDERFRKHDREQKYRACHDLFVGATQLVQQSENAEYLVVFCSPSKPFNKMVYCKFLEDCPKDSYSLEPFWIYKCNPQQIDARDGSTLKSDDIHVVAVEDNHALDYLAESLARRYSPIELESIHLDRSRIGQSITLSSEGSEDLPIKRRGRTLWIALSEERPVGAMVCDRGEEGINIFNLFNTCQYFRLADSADVREEDIVERLLSTALIDYRRRGMQEMLFLARENERAWGDRYKQLGFCAPIEGMRWIVQRTLFSAWVDYLHDLFRGLGAQILDRKTLSQIVLPWHRTVQDPFVAEDDGLARDPRMLKIDRRPLNPQDRAIGWCDPPVEL